MKVDYITLSILLIILLISCCVITFHIRRNNLRNEINLYDKNLLHLLNTNDIKETFDGHIDTFDIAGLTKISNIKILNEDDTNKKFNMRLLLIEGENLNKIKGVFFGDIKGKIIKTEDVGEKNDDLKEMKMYILPPDMVKYESIMSNEDFRNIEIKLLIEEPDYLDAGDKIEQITIKNTGDGKEFDIKKVGEVQDLDIVLKNDTDKKKKHIFTVNVVEKSWNSIEQIAKTYEKSLRAQIDIELLNIALPSDNKKSKIKIGGIEENIVFEKEGDKINKTLYVKLPNIDLINRRIKVQDIKFIFEEGKSKDLSFKIKRIDIKLITDDIEGIFPTGLFYRQTGITTGNKLIGTDKKEWKLFLGDRVIEDGNVNSFGKIQSKELNAFYKNIRNSLGDETETPKEEKAETNYSVTELKTELDKNDDTQIKVTWKIPPSVTDFNYAFLLNFNSKSGKESFQIKNEKLSFDKNSYMFSNKNLVPMNEYNIKIDTIRYKPNTKIIGTTEEVYKYVPFEDDNYHSHLFKDGKFDIEKIDLDKLAESNPKLVQTYYELLEFNRNKTLNEVGDLQLEIEKIVNTAKNDVKDTECGTNKNDKTSLPEKIKEYTEQQIKIVEDSEPQQLEKMELIKKKINYLNELRNKKEKDVNMKFKSLKSLNDGTILRLEDLGQERKMVLLNNGCLAFEKNQLFGKNGNFGYVKCNVFDTQQQFRVKKIESIEDYNNLMDLNLEEKISKESEQKFSPFYILQPMNSNKCVFINDSKLSVKKCQESDDIKFQGYFSQSHCNV